MRRGEFRSVEGVKDIHLLALQALDIGASVETESGVCENPRKTYSLKTIGVYVIYVEEK